MCGENIYDINIQWATAKDPSLKIRVFHRINQKCINYEDEVLLTVLNDGNTIRY